MMKKRLPVVLSLCLAGMGWLATPGAIRAGQVQSDQGSKAASKSSTSSQAAAAAPQAFTEQEVLKLVKKNKKHLDRITPELSQRGVDFNVTPQIEAKLRKVGADSATMAVIQQGTPAARAARAAQGKKAAGPVISPAEAQAYNATRNELDPDKGIQLCETFAKTFPKSIFLSYVYAFEAHDYAMKNDVANAAVYAEKAAKTNSRDMMALIMAAEYLPEPAALQGSDLMKNQKLDEAEGDAKKALSLIPMIPKAPTESDADFKTRKADYASQMHAALGLIHLQRADMSLAGPDKTELAKAEQEYKTAISLENPPNPADYFRLGEVYKTAGNVPAAIDAFNNAAKLVPPNSQIATLVGQEIRQLKAQKNSAAKP